MSVLQSIRIENFRNIDSLSIDCHPHFNFFHGENAQGKTSVLEAIYFLSALKSFRTSHLSSVLPQGKNQEALLEARLISSEELVHETRILLGLNARQVLWNGKTPRPLAKLRQTFPMILFTPDSTRLFKGSPGTRRAYFDELFSLLSPSFQLSTAQYAQVLKQKQKLLEEEHLFTSKEWKMQLEAWNQKLAELGAQILGGRFFWTAKLASLLRPLFQELSAHSWRVEFSYEPYLNRVSPEHSVEDLRKQIQQELNQRMEEERIRRQLLVGPHRDDWLWKLNGGDLREEGSQGQHRVAVASLKLAEVQLFKEQGKTPLALFDDLLSELDTPRSEQMLKRLSEYHCQIFLTSVTPCESLMDQFDGKAFHLVGGKVL